MLKKRDKIFIEICDKLGVRFGPHDKFCSVMG